MAAKAADPGKRYILWDAQVPGLGLRVSDKATDERKGAFVLVARFPGSSNPVARRIGYFPATSISSAREKAREWRSDLERGSDPKVKAAEAKRLEAARRDDTFRAAFEAYDKQHLSHPKKPLRTGRVVKLVVEKHVYPVWGEWPLTDIKRRHVIDLIDKMAVGTPTNANRCLAYLKHFFAWAVEKDKLELSPAAGVKKTKELRRERVLTDREIRAIWAAAGQMGAFGRAVQLLLVTGQRRSEVGSVPWTELDLPGKTWRMPQERTKANRAHEVPLSSRAIQIIESADTFDGCPFVFSTGLKRKEKKAGEKQIGKKRTADDFAPLSGWGAWKQRLDKLASEAFARLDGAAPPEGQPIRPLPDWHLHDLRRTAATNMARLGVDRVVIAHVLNHADGSVTAVYDRHRYDVEKRRALDLWAERLGDILGGNSSNVIQLPFAASDAAVSA